MPIMHKIRRNLIITMKKQLAGNRHHYRLIFTIQKSYICTRKLECKFTQSAMHGARWKMQHRLNATENAVTLKMHIFRK